MESRTFLDGLGSFVAVPSAFAKAPEGLRSVCKISFKTVYSESSTNPLKLEHVFSSDGILIDMASADPESFDAERMSRDCDLLKTALTNHPEKVRELIKAVQSTEPDADFTRAQALAEEMGLTEEASLKAGGGIIPVLLFAAAFLLAGCQAHCTGRVKPDKFPPPRR